MLAAAACGFLLICKHAICALFWISCVGNKVLKTIYRQKRDGSYSVFGFNDG